MMAPPPFGSPVGAPMGTPSSAGAATPTSATSAATDNSSAPNGAMLNKYPKKEEGQQQNNSVWSEHVNAEGKKYYYNRLTKKSVWDKPEELKSKEEVRNSAIYNILVIVHVIIFYKSIRVPPGKNLLLLFFSYGSDNFNFIISRLLFTYKYTINAISYYLCIPICHSLTSFLLCNNSSY